MSDGSGFDDVIGFDNVGLMIENECSIISGHGDVMIVKERRILLVDFLNLTWQHVILHQRSEVLVPFGLEVMGLVEKVGLGKGVKGRG